MTERSTFTMVASLPCELLLAGFFIRQPTSLSVLVGMPSSA